jgi:hypothetical protein
VNGLGYRGAALQLVAAQQGGYEGHPPAVVITHGPPGASRVRATFLDGSTDQTAPVDGWAVLAANANDLRATVTATGSTAQVLATISVATTYPPSAEVTLPGVRLVDTSECSVLDGEHRELMFAIDGPLRIRHGACHGVRYASRVIYPVEAGAMCT